MSDDPGTLQCGRELHVTRADYDEALATERTAREAAEAELAKATAYCACGDGIMPRDPGYCGTCGMELRHRLRAAEAEVARLRSEIERLIPAHIADLRLLAAVFRTYEGLVATAGQCDLAADELRGLLGEVGQ